MGAPTCEDTVLPSPRSTAAFPRTVVDPSAVGGALSGSGFNPPDWIPNSGVHDESQVVCCSHLWRSQRVLEYAPAACVNAGSVGYWCTYLWHVGMEGRASATVTLAVAVVKGVAGSNGASRDELLFDSRFQQFKAQLQVLDLTNERKADYSPIGFVCSVAGKGDSPQEGE